MDRMTRQLEGILKNGDVFHQSEEVGKLNLKKCQSLRHNESRTEFLSYLKPTCCHEKKQKYDLKRGRHTMPSFETQMHHHLILTMRTQYDARPNS